MHGEMYSYFKLDCSCKLVFLILRVLIAASVDMAVYVDMLADFQEMGCCTRFGLASNNQRRGLTWVTELF
jgi:hypothetical protein